MRTRGACHRWAPSSPDKAFRARTLQSVENCTKGTKGFEELQCLRLRGWGQQGSRAAGHQPATPHQTGVGRYRRLGLRWTFGGTTRSSVFAHLASLPQPHTPTVHNLPHPFSVSTAEDLRLHPAHVRKQPPLHDPGAVQQESVTPQTFTLPAERYRTSRK